MQKDMEQQEIQEKMIQISELSEKEDQGQEVQDIYYYKDFIFQGSNLAENNIFIAKVENMLNNTSTYEIYSGTSNTLIATVDEQGILHFMPEYLEMLRQVDDRIVEMLDLENLKFELPKELEKEDIIFTRQERENIIKKEKVKDENISDKQNDEKVEEKDSNKESKEEQIAEVKGIPQNNILLVKENSNLYKDHPNLEPNLYFYRDNDGTVKAEYLDSKGDSHPSKYFEPSTTNLRQETVSLGDDGNPVKKEVPYQVMRTKSLNNVDKDIRDIRINIKFDTYGYLDIEEARQGKNGEWLSHDIEVKGRDYNSRAVNETTSIRTRKADPDKQTEAYEKTEDTGLAKDEVQYSEMYLISHADEFIDRLIAEGYQKKEAVQIFDYMIGDEALTLKEAKEKVNKQITSKKDKENDYIEDNEKDNKGIEDEGRTPWGDAEAREMRLHKPV